MRLVNMSVTYAPDAVALVASQVLRSLHVSPAVTSFNRFLFIEFLLVLNVAAAFLQDERRRGGIWRRIVESPVLVLFGYCSHLLYLFQQVLINYYGRMVYEGIHDGTFPRTVGVTNPWNEIYWNTWWMREKPLLWKACALPPLLLASWLIQRYYQDWLVIGLCARLSRWIRRRTTIVPSQSVS